MPATSGALWLGAVLLAGSPPSSWLRWDAPTACPDAGYVERATAARLGRDPEPGEIEVAATVIDEGPAGLRLRLSMRRSGGPPDTREMDAHDCHALADATALMVALSVDPVAVAAAAAASVEPASAPAERTTLAPGSDPAGVVPEPEAAIPPATPPPPEDASPRDRGRAREVGAGEGSPSPATASALPREVLLHAGGGPELGALPGVSGGAMLGVGLGWRRARVEIGGLWIAPRTAHRDVASVSVQLVTAVIRGCARVGSSRLEVPLCAGVDLGVLRGAGRDAPGRRSRVGPWIAPHVTVGLHGWVLPRLAVLGRIDLSIPVVSTAFQAASPGPAVDLFRSQSLSGRFWLGIETKFEIGRDGSAERRRMDRGRS